MVWITCGRTTLTRTRLAPRARIPTPTYLPAFSCEPFYPSAVLRGFALRHRCARAVLHTRAATCTVSRTWTRACAACYRMHTHSHPPGRRKKEKKENWEVVLVKKGGRGEERMILHLRHLTRTHTALPHTAHTTPHTPHTRTHTHTGGRAGRRRHVNIDKTFS